jgi:hypothetical protein
LKHLLALPKLRVLDIERTFITDLGVEMLKEHIPRMNIIYENQLGMGDFLEDKRGVIWLRCQSCGIRLDAQGISGNAACKYCGFSFTLPDPAVEPELYVKTYQRGYNVDKEEELREALTWVIEQEAEIKLSDCGTCLVCSNFREMDQGMKYVAKLDNLRNLDLGGSDITDAGLSHLLELPHYKLPQLRILNLQNTNVSDAGLAGLKDRFPKTQIRYRGIND